MTTYSASFGDLLRRHRMAAGLTQDELAEQSGVSARAICDLERGARHVPRRGTLQMLLEALRPSEQERKGLEAAARRLGDTAPSAERPTHAVASQATLFIGRERELAAVHALIQRLDVRLLTLAGPGGVGKTRLALHAAATLAENFCDGVYVVSLASIGEPEFVPAAVAETLGLREAADYTLVETLKDFLREQHLLLVLDNFEHLMPASSLVSELLDSCPGLSVLITSRTVSASPASASSR